MRAVRVKGFGDVDQLELVEAPDPEPQAGQGVAGQRGEEDPADGDHDGDQGRVAQPEREVGALEDPLHAAEVQHRRHRGEWVRRRVRLGLERGRDLQEERVNVHDRHDHEDDVDGDLRRPARTSAAAGSGPGSSRRRRRRGQGDPGAHRGASSLSRNRFRRGTVVRSRSARRCRNARITMIAKSMNAIADPRPHSWLLNAELYDRYAGVSVILITMECF